MKICEGSKADVSKYEEVNQKSKKFWFYIIYRYIDND